MIKNKFRGFLPVVIDVETAGFEAKTDALLELAAIPIIFEKNNFVTLPYIHEHIIPFEGANLDQDALEFNKIDPFHPFRFAISELQACIKLKESIDALLKEHQCTKAVLTGHNAWFDLSFINACFLRSNIKSPFHSFTSFDTATLCGVFYGQTVLSRALKKAKISFNPSRAHGALYDARKTAELFCKILNTKNDI